MTTCVIRLCVVCISFNINSLLNFMRNVNRLSINNSSYKMIKHAFTNREKFSQLEKNSLTYDYLD